MTITVLYVEIETVEDSVSCLECFVCEVICSRIFIEVEDRGPCSYFFRS